MEPSSEMREQRERAERDKEVWTFALLKAGHVPDLRNFNDPRCSACRTSFHHQWAHAPWGMAPDNLPRCPVPKENP
jgi:hypothetical protein